MPNILLEDRNSFVDSIRESSKAMQVIPENWKKTNFLSGTDRRNYNKKYKDGNFTNLSEKDLRAVLFDTSQNIQQTKLAISSKMMCINSELDRFNTEKFDISLDINAIRYIIERIAILSSLFEKVDLIRSNCNIPIKEFGYIVNEQSDAILKIVSGTRINWKTVVDLDFSEISKKGIKYKEDLLASQEAGQILNHIDFLDKKIKGTRILYEILCEFVHPNVGDLISKCTTARVSSDEAGNNFVYREYGGNKEKYDSYPAEFLVYKKILSFTEIVILDFSEKYNITKSNMKVIEKKCRSLTHYGLANLYQLFDDKELCPCFSGKKIIFCAKEDTVFRKRMKGEI